MGVWGVWGKTTSFWEDYERDSLSAEILGIGEALKKIGVREKENFVVHMDCLAAPSVPVGGTDEECL